MSLKLGEGTRVLRKAQTHCFLQGWRIKQATPSEILETLELADGNAAVGIYSDLLCFVSAGK
jgi:hypothetical protein